MTNFSIFSKETLRQTIDAFLPGAVGHITPIKYQAITPDIFAFMFRTTGRDNGQFFFVSLEYDYLTDVEVAEKYIREWSGSEVKEFLKPQTAQEDYDAKLGHISVKTSGPYYAVLALVDRPRGLGYWSDSIVILPGESLAEKLVGKDWDEKRRGFVANFLKGITKSDTLPATNTSKYAVAVYVHDGETEIFYN